ncbi:hypothetical protein NBRC116493_08450 [Aurantivibrio infirmus]
MKTLDVMKAQFATNIRGERKNYRILVVLALLITSLGAQSQMIQDPAKSGDTDLSWFGIIHPPGFKAHSVPLILSDRGPRPVFAPEGEADFEHLRGAEIKKDLAAVIEFSKQSRDSNEIGSGQLWGRLSGFSSGANTVNWALGKFAEAGITETSRQSFNQDADSEFWMPLSWKLTLLANSKFGEKSKDIVLESAMPLSPSSIPGGKLKANLIYVGGASAAELEKVDVAGKIAVQRVIPQGHLVFERQPVVPNSRELFSRGAIAVINVIQQPGNERAIDFRNCGGPCFNLGGRDGHFLLSVMNKVTEKSLNPELKMEIQLQTELRSNLKATNAIGVIPGKGEQEIKRKNIIVNAHTDAWFDGAGDNADGLAVMIALAKHFSKPKYQLQRDIIFVASAGHHSPGLNGPRNFVAMNSEVAKSSSLVINIEHVAQRNISPARSLFEDGYREYIADANEAPIVAGISNQSPFLKNLFDIGVERYGTNFVSGDSSMASGEGGGYRSMNVPIVTTMQAPPLYHTSGEVLEVISEPGLERIARFLAFFIKEVDAATENEINP